MDRIPRDFNFQILNRAVEPCFGAIVYLENWRPISLLNIDYKTKADRISKVLPKLIHEDRYIGQNIRLVKDIMKVTSLDKIPGMAIFIDFKKAFDSVDWNFLAKVLDAFNFGP